MDLTDLGIPIAASAGAVFVASSLIWMATPIHKKDYLPLEGGEEMGEWLKMKAPAAGRYLVGWCQPSKDKTAPPVDPKAPRGMLLVQYGSIAMGKTLLGWLAFLLVASAMIGYVATFSLGRGASCGSVFRVASTVALLVHGGGAVPKAIWEGIPWRHVPGALFDAVVYATVTGGVFCWLWPAA
jgi:hypothetical protein